MGHIEIEPLPDAKRLSDADLFRELRERGYFETARHTRTISIETLNMMERGGPVRDKIYFDAARDLARFIISKCDTKLSARYSGSHEYVFDMEITVLKSTPEIDWLLK